MNSTKIKKANEELLFAIVSVLIVCLNLVFAAFNSYAQGDSIVVFSENWDNTTKTRPWDFFNGGWWDQSHISLVQAEGHGNALRVNFPKGTIGSESGLGNYLLPLDSSYRELYLSWEYYLPEDIDLGYGDGNGGGKFFGGFAGGSMANIPHLTGLADTVGWCSIFVWQNGFYTNYNYFNTTSYYTDPSTGHMWPTGTRMDYLERGKWDRITIRIKMNDAYQSNGIFEVFDKDTLVFSQTEVKFASDAHQEYLIDGIYLNNFWGGSSPNPVSQYMQFDNLVAFYYPPGSPDHREGASENGRVVKVPGTSSYHPLPANAFREETYTEPSGTINSHCAFYTSASKLDYSFLTSTIHVEGADSLFLNVTRFNYDGGTENDEYMQTLNIYQGTGSGKMLVKTFKKNVYLTVPSSLIIPGNSATIEWRAGLGSASSFSLDYASNGIGSGMNYTCGDFVAKQGIPVDSLFTLVTGKVGEGTVTPGISSYPDDAVVSLNAIPKNGWDFYKWTGDTVNTDPSFTVRMNKDRHYVANFTIGFPDTVVAKVNFTYNSSYDEPGWTNIYGDASLPADLGNGIRLSGDGSALIASKDGEQETVLPMNVGSTCIIDIIYGRPVKFTVSGLDPSSVYTFTFFSSKEGLYYYNGRRTSFTIGNETVIGNSVGNCTNLMSIQNVVPSSQGVVEIEMERYESHGYLNALVISKTGLRTELYDGDIGNMGSTISYYPVPVRDQLVLFNLQEQSTILVLNVMGSKILSVNNGFSEKFKIDMGHIKSGVYLVQVLHGPTVLKNFRIIKE